MSTTLFDRLGGEAAVMAAVDRFYEKVLDDERTRPFFEDLDMGAQTRKQVAFMTRAFGGPDEYRGRDLRTAHAELVRDRGLSDEHFDAITEHLESTLRELDLSQDDIQQVLAIIASTRDEVLNR